MSIFPLRVHPSGRYFTDSFDRPFQVRFDSAWALPCNLPAASVATYLATRKDQGFTGILIESMTHNFAVGGNNPSNAAGVLPFTTGADGASYTQSGAAGGQDADFRTPVDAFFQHVSDIIDQADALDMAVLVYPLSFGFAGGNVQGWYTSVIHAVNTRTVHHDFGQYLATGHGVFPGFAGKKNILFNLGSDYGGNSPVPPSAESEQRLLNLLQGLRDGGCTQLVGGDWQAASLATDESAFTASMQQNGIYTYGGHFGTTTVPTTGRTYLLSRDGWNFLPTLASQGTLGGRVPLALPGYIKETAYRHSSFADGTPSGVRKMQNWGLLSGAGAGIIYGNEDVWPFPNGTWQVEINDTSAQDMKRFNYLMRDLPWWKLIPSELSGMRRLVTSSNGSQSPEIDTYVAAAQAPDGSFLLAYYPTSGSGSQSATFDLSGMQASCRVRFWDPTNGKYTETTGGAYSQAATSGVGLSTPGNNSAGDNDWFLLVDVPPTALLRPLVMGGGVSFAWR